LHKQKSVCSFFSRAHPFDECWQTTAAVADWQNKLHNQVFSFGFRLYFISFMAIAYRRSVAGFF
jgi:hypothetical protein